MRAYAWRRQPDTADDVVAETFAIACQHLERVPDAALPWLIGVARNVRRNAERGDRRRRDRELRAADSGDSVSFSDHLETDSALADALRRLSDDDREILLLAAWERLDRAGPAATLGCSRTAANVRLHRVRKRPEAALAAVEAESAAVSAPRGGVLHGS